MITSSRNFSIVGISRARSTSGPTSDLGERVLTKLDELGSPSEDELLAAVGGDAASLRGCVETLVNLKLLEASAGNLRLSTSGKTALKLKLLSVAT